MFLPFTPLMIYIWTIIQSSDKYTFRNNNTQRKYRPALGINI